MQQANNNSKPKQSNARANKKSLNQRLFCKLIFIPATLCLIGTLLCSCTPAIKDGPPLASIDVNKIANPTPKPLPKSRYGNPSHYTVRGKRYHVLASAKGYDRRGLASWYGTKFHGKLTSTRETYNLYGMTAASKVLPIPCYVEVTNLKNKKHVIVKVNDRGPFVANRIMDLSYVAAKKLDMLKKGTAYVEVKAITDFRHNTHRHHYRHDHGHAKTKSNKHPVLSIHKKNFNHLNIHNKKHNAKKKYVHHLPHRLAHHQKQLGAFTSYKNAEKLRHDMIKKGRIIKIIHPQKQGKGFYRVFAMN